MQQVDDWLQTVLSTSVQCSIPERPVVPAWFWLTQTPRYAVSNDLDAESGNRAKVVVHMGVMATLRKLVLPIGHSIGKHQGIGPFLADGPCKVRKPGISDTRVHHGIAISAGHLFILSCALEHSGRRQVRLPLGQGSDVWRIRPMLTGTRQGDGRTSVRLVISSSMPTGNSAAYGIVLASDSWRHRVPRCLRLGMNDEFSQPPDRSGRLFTSIARARSQTSCYNRRSGWCGGRNNEITSKRQKRHA